MSLYKAKRETCNLKETKEPKETVQPKAHSESFGVGFNPREPTGFSRMLEKANGLNQELEKAIGLNQVLSEPMG